MRSPCSSRETTQCTLCPVQRHMLRQLTPRLMQQHSTTRQYVLLPPGLLITLSAAEISNQQLLNTLCMPPAKAAIKMHCLQHSMATLLGLHTPVLIMPAFEGATTLLAQCCQAKRCQANAARSQRLPARPEGCQVKKAASQAKRLPGQKAARPTATDVD